MDDACCSSAAERGSEVAAGVHPSASRWRIRLALLTLSAAMVWVALAGWPWVRVHLQSAAVLVLVANKPVPWGLGRFVDEPIHVQEMQLTLPSGPVRARLYTPLRPEHAPAIVLLHGMHYQGIDEPRLERFANAMAACGIAVLTPELPDIKDYQVGVPSILAIRESVEWLSHEYGGQRVGMIGLSFSGGLALVAAADPRYGPSVRFVAAVGAHDEMSRVADFYRTGEEPRPDGTTDRLAPHEYGALVLEYEHLAEFVPPNDVAPIRAVLRAHLYEDVADEHGAMAVLNTTQAGEAKALMDTTLPATRASLQQVDARHAQDMAAVSPHGRLTTLKTPVYLLHGAGDNVIPSAETEWLAAELPAKSLKAVLISPVLSHLDLDDAGPTAVDQLRLVHFFAEVLHAAEVN